MKPRTPWSAIIASVIAIAILLTLGVWQVQRLQWKSALIAEINARQSAPPVTLAEALARAERNEDIDYLNVALDGAIKPGGPLFMVASFNGGAGWSVVTPVVSGDGILVLVDRGLIAADERDQYAAETGPISVAGQAGWHIGSRNMFSPDNDAARNTWYWWDIPAMLGAVDAPAHVKIAPFTVHATPDPTRSTGPAPQPLTANLRNNHLGYAITWFGLAAALAVIAFLFIRRRMV